MFILLTLLACTGDPSCEPEQAWADADGDGFGDPIGGGAVCRGTEGYVSNGDDCDDRDASAHPGAVETCNGVDDDCDGEPDAMSLWIRDSDGDGYGAIGGEEQQACDPPPGFATDSGDCDDTNGGIHPDALEACNELDDDCDGALDEGFDEDGDGHRSTACVVGDDCDDSDPEIHGGAPEVCGDGLDNDCAGGDCPFWGNYELSASDATITGTEEYEQMPQQIEVGDVDGDGSLEVLVQSWGVGGVGGGHVLYGPFAGAMTAEDVGFTAYGMSAEAPGSIGIGDVNDDGYADIGFGIQNPPSDFVEFGPVTEDFDLVDADVQLNGPGQSGSAWGHGSDVGDINGDEIDDVVVGAASHSAHSLHAGSVFIQLGPLTAGEISTGVDSDAELYGSSEELYAGSVVRAGGDTDGDGIGDVVMQADGYGFDASAVVIVARGPFPPDLDLADADAWLVGDEAGAGGDYPRIGLAQGDVDGDGLADTLIGAPGAGGGTDDGRAYVVSGQTVGTIDLVNADVVLHGAHGGRLGTALAAGDLDADGQPELVVGAPYEGTLPSGATYLFYGAMPGTWDDRDSSARFEGEPGDYSGSSLAVADLDANGHMDLLIGAPGESAGALYCGALYIWMSY